MSILDRFFGRATVQLPNDNTIDGFFQTFGVTSLAGISVTPEKAQQYAAVTACINVISETTGQVSLDVYKYTKDGKELAPEHPNYKLLHSNPNGLMTSTVFHRAMAFSVLTQGNAYARIHRDTSMNITELELLNPYEVEVLLSNNKKKVYYKLEGKKTPLQSYEVIHIKGMTREGLVGISPLRQHADTLGLGLAEQEFASKFFANGATLSGVITKPGAMKIEQMERLGKSWKRTFSSVSKSHKTAILDDGMDYKQIGANAEQAQLLESRKFSVTEIARIYRVPPHMIGDLSQSTNNNIEHQGLEFSKYTMIPYFRAFEQEYNTKLFKESEKEIYFCRFNVESLQRGDSAARTAMYVQGIQNGWLSPNEVRQMEGFNKREGGDIYLTPLNMTTNPEEDGEESN